MSKKTLIKRKNKTLIDIPYYDEFIKNPERKNRYFKRYPKTYKISKKITQRSYSPKLKRKDKVVTFILETNQFYLLNNIYCVLNLESLKNVLRKGYPSIDKVLRRNLVESNKAYPTLLVALKFTISLTTINSQDQKSTYFIGSKNEIFTCLDDFCTFYETFMRKYYLDTQYDNHFNGIHINLIYRYGKNKTKKNHT